MNAQEHANTPESPTELFITFPGPVLCSEPGCEQLTLWGHAVKCNREREYLLRPSCWEHGAGLHKTVFEEGSSQGMVQELKLQESVVRFVVSYFDARATATVLAQVTVRKTVKLGKIERREKTKEAEPCVCGLSYPK